MSGAARRIGCPSCAWTWAAPDKAAALRALSMHINANHQASSPDNPERAGWVTDTGTSVEWAVSYEGQIIARYRDETRALAEWDRFPTTRKLLCRQVPPWSDVTPAGRTADQ